MASFKNFVAKFASLVSNSLVKTDKSALINLKKKAYIFIIPLKIKKK